VLTSTHVGKLIYGQALPFRGGTHGDTPRIIPEGRMREISASSQETGGGVSDRATSSVLAGQGKECVRE
jgi:hypothetical protein